MTDNSNLIDVHTLQLHIDDPDWTIVDCRSELGDPEAGRRSYLEGHVPGAVFADLDDDLAAPPCSESGRHPLPDVETFAATLGRLGIGNTTNVVVYDNNSGAIAARAWWMLRWLGHERVRLLDGGFEQWILAGQPSNAGDERATARIFNPRPCNERMVTTAELAEDPDTIRAMRLFDARDTVRFRGEFEPIDPVAGHIPGALNLPYPESLTGNGIWKKKADLEALWVTVLGDDKEVAWAVMCGSGVTACHLVISAMEAGFKEPRLYVGSWSEWIRDPLRPIALGGA